MPEKAKLSEEDILQAMIRAAVVIHNEVINKVQKGNIPPPLKPSTIKRKGSSKTLIDEGWLLGAVTEGFKIQQSGNKIRIEIGIFDPDVAKYAAVHEFGSAHVPQRSFLRSAYDEKKDEAEKILMEHSVKIVKDKLSSK